MIKLLDKITEKEIDFAKSSCLGVRSLGPVLAYGLNFDFLDAWTQEIDEKVTAFIIKFYGAVTVSSSADADIDEVEEFLGVIGFDSLTCDYKEGNAFVMKLEKGRDFKGSIVTNCNFIENSNYKEFYGILTRCHKDFLPNVYEDWFVDINHRVRHGYAETHLFSRDGELTSCVAVLSVLDDAIFITGVSTLPEYRGQHFAHTLIGHICEKHSDKTVYLFCAEDKVPFYEKAGFKNTSKIYFK